MKLRFPFRTKKKSEESVSTTQDILPLEKTENNVLVMKNGGIRSMIELTNLINVNLLDDTDENDEVGIVLEGFQDLLNDFDGDRFQVYVSSEPMNIDNYVSFLEQKINSENEYAYKAELLDIEREHVIEHTKNHRYTKAFYFITGSDKKDSEEKEEELRLINNEMVRGVKGISIHNSSIRAVLKSGSEYGRVLYDKLNPRLSKEQGELPSYTLDDFSPNPFFDKDTYYECDGYYYMILSIKEYPRDPSGAWMQELFRVNGHVDILVNFQKTGASKDKLINSISREMDDIESDLDRQIASASKKRKQKDLKDKDEVLDELIGDDEEVYHVSTFITLRAETKENLERLYREFLSRARHVKAFVFPLEHEGIDGFFVALPIMYNSELYRRYGKLMSARAISGFYPFVRTDFQMETGIRKGINTENGSLVIVDRMDRGRFLNGNGISLGMSGTGKTTGAELDILREISQGYKIRIVTPEPGFNFPFGTHMKISPASKYVLNPFHCNSFVVDKDEEEEDILDPGLYLRLKMGRVMEFFSHLIPKITDLEKAKLHDAILQAYRQKDYTFETKTTVTEFPILDDVVKILYEMTDMENLLVQLKPFYEGAFATLFNGHKNWKADDLHVINVGALSLELLIPAMIQVIDDFWEEVKLNIMSSNPTPYGMYIDEVWYFGDSKKPVTLEFIFQIYKRIRKYMGYAEIMTQNVADLMGNKQLKAIFNNAVFHRYYPMRFEDVKALSQIVPLTGKEVKFLLSQKEEQGTNLFIMGEHRMKTQTKYNMEELKILDPEKFTMLQKVGV
ncbi:type-IV secretion system protein TraC (plasmid) [Paenibacillus larvae subsp. larvae]|uniref:Type-IV secretion system protein TraC n=1 Tax=Paenibacillus larvae subsp. larvae TaxID=147375 RepID=A0A2L1UK48_9BACL|nr:hypothetical protein [Paenibacillus larvae]AQT87006.1 hypothetical protein B1222_23525 [Paenibacillus larvae subsp. pulvifaciens]AQZ49277.1 hypothetical protein B5S25_22485 [Paenibacillus larvae subsp. pulvifaciens]AVF28930.1 type-IV secretion system protein TraC [Paenibacillus larvae subsp. larvae]AVF33312.1 type-IV secretion system protein TraC [Paenibacillus larvae subsp. larvae]MBH0344814.1 hypothetical protein [Paenibacillus larvae]